jgi:hypothetical protein
MPEAKTFVGLAFDHPVKDYRGGSEDLAIYQWDAEAVPDMVELRRIADGIGILAEDLKLNEARTWDFPASESRKATPQGKSKNSKRKKSMAKKSRQRNRKN